VTSFEEIKPGSRLRGLDPSGIAEVVQVARFGPDALNLVFRANGRVGERLVYRGEETAFEFVEPGRTYGSTPTAACYVSLLKRIESDLPTFSTPTMQSPHRRSKHSPTRLQRFMLRCFPGSHCGSFWPTIPAQGRPSWRGS
jgi:hypothetical protein